MAYTIKKSEIITYPPEELHNFKVNGCEYIDNLHFVLSPKECLENADDYIRIVERKFKKAGWDGDGEIQLMWIPSFLVKSDYMPEHWNGIIVWHVKQKEDGISWLLYPWYLHRMIGGLNVHPIRYWPPRR
jgi:hypothetical protein